MTGMVKMSVIVSTETTFNYCRYKYCRILIYRKKRLPNIICDIPIIVFFRKASSRNIFDGTTSFLIRLPSMASVSGFTRSHALQRLVNASSYVVCGGYENLTHRSIDLPTSPYQRALPSSPNVEVGPIRMDQKLWPRPCIARITLAVPPDNVARMPEPEKQLI